MSGNDELIFAKYINKKYNIGIGINPDYYENRDLPPYTHNGGYGFLKIIHEPFFKSKELFGIDPDSSIILNSAEINRYCSVSGSLFIRQRWEECNRKINGAFIKVCAVNRILRIETANIKNILYKDNVYSIGGKSDKRYLAIDINDCDTIEVV